jgi:hypothetical protein
VAGSANVNLTTLEASNAVIVLTGAITANIDVTVPTTSIRPFTVTNNTTGAFTVTFKTLGGTGIIVAQTKSAILYNNGTNMIVSENDYGIIANGWVKSGNTATTAVDYIGTTDAQPLIVKTNGTERMRVLANGNVGIGTATPTVPLEVSGAIIAATASAATNNTQVATTAYVTTAAATKVSKTGDTMTGNLIHQAAEVQLNSVATTGNTPVLRFTSGGNTAGYLYANTTGYNGGAEATIKMVTSQGGYGTRQIWSSTISPQNQFYIDGECSANNFVTRSDVRLKKNIKDVTDASKLLQLRPVTYEKVLLGGEHADDRWFNETGLIAQEVQKVFPEFISEGATTEKYLSVNYPSLIPILIKGYQEQEAKIIAQQKELEELKTKQQKEIDELKAMVHSLMKK